ncbi:fasciclin domain-containing protein [Sphingobacterium sp.]|uniref:fasciclin domain-containing protein n=1 Tax=Sphingobacterium sp. TaxID=341027 RepID=UPI00289A95D4|nr:fasciclin domain-containing protein [Sphingobacterium sp.]
MIKAIIYKIYLALLALFLLTSCSKNWENHFGGKDADAQRNLYEIVAHHPEFSTFMNLLNKSGYGESLKASKNYTLIVPTNEAIAAIQDQYNFSDTAVIKSFVGYHIINSVYNVNSGADTVKALNFRNKYVEFTHGTFDGVEPLQSNLVASNGLYHVVGRPLKPLQNIFNLVHTFFADTKQIEALNSFDTVSTEGDILYYRYSPVWYTEVRRNMTTENRKHTYFVVDDENFETEYAKLKPFYATAYEEGNTHRPDSTTAFFAKKALLRDFIVAGELGMDQLTNNLISIAGTKFSLDPAHIISRTKASNGVVYRVKRLEFALADQIKEINVLGTRPIGYKQADKRSNTFFRDKRDNEGNLYNDIEVYDHKVTSFYVKYRATGMNVAKYKVYGRAIMGLAGDPQTAAFIQYVYFFDPKLISVNEADVYKRSVVNNLGANDTRMTFDVQPLNHGEVYLGVVTQDQYGNLPLLVMSNGTGPIILEYLRFVPIIQ